MFCMRCGAVVGEEDKFCEKCGYDLKHPVPVNSMPVNPQMGSVFPSTSDGIQSVTKDSLPSTGTQTGAVSLPRPASPTGQTTMFRFRCPSCKHVYDGPDSSHTCKYCGQNFDIDRVGVLSLYRKGAFAGALSTAGTGIYVDKLPHGHIGMTQRVNILLPMGNHRLHCTNGGAKSNPDLYFELSPERPICYATVQVSFGFIDKVILQSAHLSDMPEENRVYRYEN